MPKVNAKFKIPHHLVNEEITPYVLEIIGDDALIELISSNRYKGDDETVVYRVYALLTKMNIDVYNNPIEFVWGEFEY